MNVFSAQTAADAEPFEKLADLLFDVGKDLLDTGEPKKAERWLDRAYQTLFLQNVDYLSNDSGELRLSIVHKLGKNLAQACLCNDIAKMGWL